MATQNSTFPLLIVMMFSLIGCSQLEPQEVKSLSWVETATSPGTDAVNALSKGDHRLLAVRGLSISIPFTDPKDFDRLSERYGIKVIEGTTDALKNQKHRILVGKAIDYAMAYNACIIHYYKIPNKPAAP